jgi:hypothetical protein
MEGKSETMTPKEEALTIVDRLATAQCTLIAIDSTQCEFSVASIRLAYKAAIDAHEWLRSYIEELAEKAEMSDRYLAFVPPLPDPNALKKHRYEVIDREFLKHLSDLLTWPDEEKREGAVTNDWTLKKQMLLTEIRARLDELGSDTDKPADDSRPSQKEFLGELEHLMTPLGSWRGHKPIKGHPDTETPVDDISFDDGALTDEKEDEPAEEPGVDGAAQLPDSTVRAIKEAQDAASRAEKAPPGQSPKTTGPHGYDTDDDSESSEHKIKGHLILAARTGFDVKKLSQSERTCYDFARRLQGDGISFEKKELIPMIEGHFHVDAAQANIMINKVIRRGALERIGLSDDDDEAIDDA